MQLHVAADRLPEASPVKPSLSRVLQLMGQVIDEGRNAVRGLRSPDSGSSDLAEAFSRIQGELGIEERIDFRVIVEGQPRPLHPLLRDEIYRIGREALVNALRHARAKKIAIEVEYSSSRLRILVHDDGCGIDPQVLHSGRDGHWGLSGMRERAERIGGGLHVWSGAAAGTEIELSVPSHAAFLDQRRHKLTWWGRRFAAKAGRP
jgi:signal transduction histidine kinase